MKISLENGSVVALPESIDEVKYLLSYGKATTKKYTTKKYTKSNRTREKCPQCSGEYKYLKAHTETMHEHGRHYGRGYEVKKV